MPAQAHEFDRAFPGQCEGDINRKQVILVSTGTIVVIVVVIVVVAAAVVMLMAAARRRRLKQRFGPEYDRAVDEHASKLKAEAELSGRERRVHGLDIRPARATRINGPVSSSGSWTSRPRQSTPLRYSWSPS
jgi:hypothetical protein